MGGDHRATGDALVVTGDLRLEPVRRADVDGLHSLFLDEYVRRYVLDGEVVDRDWVRAAVDRSRVDFEHRAAGLWLLRGPAAEAGLAEAGSSSSVAGYVGFRDFFEPPRCQLLYAVAPALWGRGLVTRAAARLLDHVFEDLGWPAVEAAVDEPNTASVRVLERLGFERFAPDDPGLRRGPFGETLFFGLTSSAWLHRGDRASVKGSHRPDSRGEKRST